MAPTVGSISYRPPRSRFENRLLMVLVAVACGFAGAFAAIVFRILIRFFTALFFGGLSGVHGFFAEGWLAEARDPLEVARALPWYARLLIPAIGGLVVGPLVTLFPREAKGHGVPEVMEAVAVRGGVIRRRTVALRTLASAITIGSGGSVGREGPIVQIGSALGSTIGQMLNAPPRFLRTIVGCGAAAGMAATFNAPIGGALFAVEVIVGDFAVTAFSPIVVSSVVATVLSRYFLGDYPAFVVPAYTLVSPFELLPYMVVGVIAGAVAFVFMRSVSFSESFFEGRRIPPSWLQAATGGLLVGAIGIGLPNVFGVGYSSMNPALTGQIAPALLALLLVAKILATSITVGSGGSGGVFAPSLFLGAMAGGLFGSFVHQWFPDATAASGAYALVTMGAVVAATTHAPLTAIIMIFEMTQTISIIPPLMAACVVSLTVVTLLQRESIYTMKLVLRGIDVRKAPDPNVLKSLCVKDVMDSDVATVPHSARFEEVLDLVVRSDHVEFYVVDRNQDLLGAISLSEVRRLLFERENLRHLVVAEDLVASNPPTVTEDDDLDTVMRILGHANLNELAVVDRNDPRKLVGSVSAQTVIDAYNDAILRRDLAGGISNSLAMAGRVDQVELGDGYVIRQVETPLSFMGRSLSEIDLRARYGVQAVLIRSPMGSDAARRMRVPSPTDRLAAGDVLILAGPKEAVEALAADVR